VNEPTATGAPYEQAHWLQSVLSALPQLSQEYRIDPRGVAQLQRVTAKFAWDSEGESLYAKLLDTLPGSGCVGGDVVTMIDRRTQSVNEAAARIHGRIVSFLNSLLVGSEESR